MSNEAVFRATTGCRACSEALDYDGECSCSRGRQAAVELCDAALRRSPPAEEFDYTPPDPYAAEIAARRHELGYAPLPDPRPAAPVRAARPYVKPVFPLAGNPPPDPYEAQIVASRRKRGITFASLPSDYRPDGPPPDPYAADIARRRAAEVA